MIIQTERLVLRPFEKNDIKWYYDLVQDEELKKRLPSLVVDNVQQAIIDVELFIKGDCINDFYYVIMDKANNVLGIIIAVRITNITIDVSYFLNREHRHNGYMHEALENLLVVARKENPVYRFRMVIDDDNIESLNVVNKFGAVIKQQDNKYICNI